ncbi:MAG: radical SAM protein [Candidatus Aminicenantales bacterium]
MNEENLNLPFDPVQRAEEAESSVMRGERRLYYRFRPAPYYGGIATADAVGCSFLCAYCWNYYRNLNPWRFKNFYLPQEVASRLINIARRKYFRSFRVSGAEPILGDKSFEHLRRVIEIIFQDNSQSIFILETNGFILGYKPELAEKLRFKNLYVRVCLKGTDEDSFELITGAKREFFRYPLVALRELQRQGIRAWPALMRDIFSGQEIKKLEIRLQELGIKGKLELEFLEAYPFVLENMKKRGIKGDSPPF